MGKTICGKRIYVLFFFCCLLLLFSMPGTSAASAAAVTIVIDNRMVDVPADDQPPLIIQGRTYVPIRIVSENLGAAVHWDQPTRQVIIASPNRVLTPAPPRNPGETGVQLVVDGSVLEVPSDYGTPFITERGRTVVPFRAVGEALGCWVDWNAATQTVEIKSPVAGGTDPSRDSDILPPVGSSDLLDELASYRANLRLVTGQVINSVDLLGRSETEYSPEQLDRFRSDLSLLQKYERIIRLPSGKEMATADLTILGDATTNARQLEAWVVDYIGSAPPSGLAELYLSIGADYGLRGDLAFCQAAKETSFWRFTGDVQPWQNNYCGLWATGSPCTGSEPLNGADPDKVEFEPGVHGAIFASPAVGVEAHIQHLYAYACREPLPRGKVLYDPRYNLVNRGSAPTWQQLSTRWAPGITYGQSIIHDYWLKTLN